MARGRALDAQKALQWLRGWVTPQTVHKEFTELQSFSSIVDTCASCTKQSVECVHDHPKPTICQKLNELKRKRNIKAFILCANLYFLNQFGLTTVWQPYIIQVLNALGTPINASLVTVMNATFGITASLALMLTIKTFGRRKLYLTSIMMIAICSILLSESFQSLNISNFDISIDFNFVLGVYGFMFFPSGWTSFRRYDSDQLKTIQQNIGNYSYLALATILLMHFTTRFAIHGLPNMFASEVYPFK